MKIDLTKLTDPAYLFEPRPEWRSEFLWLLVIFFASAILLALILIIIKIPTSVIIRQQYLNLLLTCGLIGLWLVFSRWQSLPYLASRFLLVVLLIIMIGWLGKIIIYIKVTLPKTQMRQTRENQREKYLPQPKNKR